MTASQAKCKRCGRIHELDALISPHIEELFEDKPMTAKQANGLRAAILTALDNQQFNYYDTQRRYQRGITNDAELELQMKMLSAINLDAIMQAFQSAIDELVAKKDMFEEDITKVAGYPESKWIDAVTVDDITKWRKGL